MDKEHAGCLGELRGHFEEAGVEATVSVRTPLVLNPYTTALTCPHGVTYWFEPTGDQIAKWARDGVE